MTPRYTIAFTKAGLEKMQQEYDELTRLRPERVQELTRARDLGDRSENGAYREARRKLSSTDSRLHFLKKTLEHAVVREATQSEYVEIGSTVTINNGSKDITYQIVGEHEADPMQGKLSHRSPVGQALLGRKTGQQVSIELPASTVMYTVINIESL